MNKRRRNILIVVAGLVLLVVVAAIAGRFRSGGATVVREQTIRYRPFTIRLPESGVVQHPQTQTIASQIAGNLGRIFVKAGDRVYAGQLLATIENPQILSNAQSSAQAYRSAAARARSADANGRTNIAQAEANVETARARLAQAQQDVANGSQSGLGYGGTTAADQRAQADANLANAETTLREARRIWMADQDLYANKAISRDQLDQARAKFDQARVADNQARLQRVSLGGQLTRSQEVLRDNLRSAQEGFTQAETALAAAQVQAGGGDVAAANAEAARAGSEYTFAQEQAAETQVRAPYSATVLSVAAEKSDALRPLQSGDPIELGQPLFTLAGDQGFVVRTKVDEQDIINVQFGQRAQVTGEDFPGRTLSGRVVVISPIAQKSDDPSSTARQVITTIRLDRAPSFLRDGMSVDVDILTTDLPHAIVVPNDAVLREDRKKYVYVVRQGIAHKQPVRIVKSNDTSSVVASGLRIGDVIVAQKPTGLLDGAPIAQARETVAPASTLAP